MLPTGNGCSRRFRQVLLAEEDFAACRDLWARESEFSADILAPVAHQVRLAAKVLSGRKDLPQSIAVTLSGIEFIAPQ